MIKYPNGKVYIPPKRDLTSENKPVKNIFNAANRGMGLEEDINLSNEYYNNLGLCLIYKRPTPIRIVKCDYSSSRKITEAYFSEKSTTDYNGVYKGRYMDFEAKETESKTSFSYHNIRPQQIIHLKSVIKQNGIAFFIVRMKYYSETYLLKCEDLFAYMELNSRKSLPYSCLKEKGYLIKEGYSPRLEYLSAVDRAFFN